MQTETAIISECYKMGYDAEMNGANQKNCHYSIFNYPEKLEAWEKGKRDAKAKKITPVTP